MRFVTKANVLKVVILGCTAVLGVTGGCWGGGGGDKVWRGSGGGCSNCA